MPRRTKKDEPPKQEAASSEEGGQRSSRAFWSGTISFGLVTIPVELFSGTRSTRVSLRMLAPSGNPVSRRYFTEDGKPVEGDSLTRGYEIDKGEFVEVTDQELEQLAPEQSRDIDLSRFVDRTAIPPLFFERSYILAPTGQSNAAYRLLASTLERTDKAGIASFVMRGKQYVVAITGREGLLRAETLRFAEELRSPADVGLPSKKEADEALMESLRKQIAKDHTRSVPERELNDSYWQRLEKLVEKKKKHNEDVVKPDVEEEPDEELAEVIDLVAILKKSLGDKAHGKSEEVAESKPKAKPAAKKAASKKAAAKPATKAAAKKKSAAKRAKSGT